MSVNVSWFRKRPAVVGLVAIVCATFVVYAAYFAWLLLPGPPSPHVSRFREFGDQVVRLRTGADPRFHMGAFGEGPPMCSFWRFEVRRVLCFYLALTVRDYKPEDLERARPIAEEIAAILASPCDPLDNELESYRRALARKIQCGERHLQYRLSVQVVSSYFIQTSAAGAGYYDTEARYTVRKAGAY